ncbi:MAG: hypothetical protein ACI934_000525 [Pseudohongiellaceae bacterium]|jgi:hypothetical protein
MKSKEKKLIGLAGIIFLVVVVVRVIPLLMDSYDEGLDEIDFLEQRIERLRFLVEEAPFIVDEEAEKRAEVAVLEDWVFTGQDSNLIGTSVQRQLRQAVEEADVTPRSYNTPRIAETRGWILVTQEMDFVIEQENILKFLELLENSRPKLHVTEFSINRNRRQYTGSITVTGFSKTL